MALYPTFQVDGQQDAAAEQGPLFKTGYRVDQKTGDIVIDSAGKAIPTDGTETWQQWCARQIQTERYAFAGYSTDIGVEIEAAMNQPTREAQESMIERTVTEAVLADKQRRASRITNFQFVWSGDSCVTSFTVVGNDGSEVNVSAKIGGQNE